MPRFTFPSGASVELHLLYTLLTAALAAVAAAVTA